MSTVPAFINLAIFSIILTELAMDRVLQRGIIAKRRNVTL